MVLIVSSFKTVGVVFKIFEQEHIVRFFPLHYCRQRAAAARILEIQYSILFHITVVHYGTEYYV